jgi:hypothetical protein
MYLVWSKSFTGKVSPQLWYVALPIKGEGEPDTRNRVVQSHQIPDALMPTLDALPDGVARLDYLASIYPYKEPITADTALDTPLMLSEVTGAHIDGAVDAYRQRMRALDGQSAQIDKERANHVS